MRVCYSLLLVSLVACGGGGSSYSTAPPPPPGPTPPPPSPTGTLAVTITNYTFAPDTQTIAAGQSVRWTNMDGVAHTVTSDTGSTLNSGGIAGTGMDSYGNPTNGGNYSHTFYSKGTFLYHCSNHPTMKGVVIVN